MVEGWQVLAKALGVPDMIIHGHLSVVLYAGALRRQAGVHRVAGGVRPEPAGAAGGGFIRQSNAVIAHDVESQLGRIKAPTQITFGRDDLLTSTRFADRLKSGIRDSEVTIFEGCAHAAIYENVEEFNQRTLAFLQRQARVGLA